MHKRRWMIAIRTSLNETQGNRLFSSHSTPRIYLESNRPSHYTRRPRAESEKKSSRGERASERAGKRVGCLEANKRNMPEMPSVRRPSQRPPSCPSETILWPGAILILDAPSSARERRLPRPCCRSLNGAGKWSVMRGHQPQPAALQEMVNEIIFHARRCSSNQFQTN